MTIEAVDQRPDASVSYARDGWPWVYDFSTDPPFYRRAFDIFLLMSSLPVRKATYTNLALKVFDRLAPDALEIGRWGVFRVPKIGDMDDAVHTLRQASITIYAADYDKERFQLSLREIDILVAAALLHDIGELVVGDTPVGSMMRSNRLFKLWEVKAAFHRIASLGLPRRRVAALQEIYWKVTTELEEQELVSVESWGGVRLIEAGKSSFSRERVRWELLRELFKIYESYGYLITAFELWPGIDSFSETDKQRIRAGWDREELREALRSGDVSEHMRVLALIIDVMSRQWQLILEVEDVLPSARVSFRNDFTEWIIPEIVELTGLDFQPLGNKG